MSPWVNRGRHRGRHRSDRSTPARWIDQASAPDPGTEQPRGRGRHRAEQPKLRGLFRTGGGGYRGQHRAEPTQAETPGRGGSSWHRRWVRPALGWTRLSPEGRAERNRITTFLGMSVVPATMAMLFTGSGTAAMGTQVGMLGPQGAASVIADRRNAGMSLPRAIRKGWSRDEGVETARMSAIAGLGLGTGTAVAAATGGSLMAGITASLLVSPVQGALGTLIQRARSGRSRARWSPEDTAEVKRWCGIGAVGTGGTLLASMALQGTVTDHVGETVGNATPLLVASALAPVQGWLSAKLNERRAVKDVARAQKEASDGLRQEVSGHRLEPRFRRWSDRRPPEAFDPDRLQPRAAARLLRQRATADNLRKQEAWQWTYALEERAAKLHAEGLELKQRGREAGRNATWYEREAKRTGAVATELETLARRLAAQQADGATGGQRDEQPQQWPQAFSQQSAQAQQYAQTNRADAAALNRAAKLKIDEAKGLYNAARKLQARRLTKVAARSDRAARMAEAATADQPQAYEAQNRASMGVAPPTGAGARSAGRTAGTAAGPQTGARPPRGREEDSPAGGRREL